MRRVCFVGRRGVTAMEERARSLARHLSADWTAGMEFRDGPGGLGSLRAFVRTLGASAGSNVVWLLSQHPARVLAARIGRLLFRTPFVVDTGDLLAESLRTEGRSALRIAVAAWLERLSVRWPSAVVVRGSAHIPILERQGVKRIVLIPDAVDLAAGARRDATLLRRRIGAEGKVTVGVLSTISLEGSGLPSPGWDVVECVARLPDLDLLGVVVGDGAGMPALRALALRRGVSDRMRFVGRVPPEEVPVWMSAIDIFLHTALNNPMSAVRTTGKLPHLLAAGSAAVVSRVGEASRVLEGTGLLLEFDGTTDDYAARLAERVRGIVTRGELERWREAGPRIARQEFDYVKLGARAEALLNELTAR